MQLDGHIEQFPLRELIEMVVYSSVKGLLELRTSSDYALLYFTDGTPCYAQAGPYFGLEAVGYMFELRDASFRFYANSEPETQNLWMDALELIESAEHLAASWAPLRPHIPSMDAVPVLAPRINMDTVQINDAYWPVLSSIDGQRSINRIAETLRYNLLDVCIAVVALKQQGLILIHEAPALPAPRSEAAPADARAEGYFEKLIARTLEEEAQKPNSRYAPPNNYARLSRNRSDSVDDSYRSAEGRYVDAEG